MNELFPYKRPYKEEITDEEHKILNILFINKNNADYETFFKKTVDFKKDFSNEFLLSLDFLVPKKYYVKWFNKFFKICEKTKRLDLLFYYIVLDSNIEEQYFFKILERIVENYDLNYVIECYESVIISKSRQPMWNKWKKSVFKRIKNF
jgi:hypothetical protein